jgi:thiol-disulfide isomerase/thioredoxin
MDSSFPRSGEVRTLTNRRRLLYGAVAVAAAAAGAGLAWWRHTPGEASSDATTTLWNSSFDTPQGTQLAMQAFRGKPLLLNFWATWCPPCIEELPMIDAFYRQNASKNWQVLGLAIDQPSAVRTFLARTPVSFPIGLAGLEGTELGKSLGNASGGLPFTVVLSADGRLLHRKMGRLTDADLAAWSQPA